MSESSMRLHLLLLLFFCCVSPSSFFTFNFHFKNPVVGLVACPPRQIQAFMEFKNEFDTRGCNHSDPFNGVCCDNSTGEVTMLRLRACLSGTLKSNIPNSSASSRLEFLYLGRNHLEGKIIKPISKLINLKYLDLGSLNTSDPIDLSLFSSLKSLVYLDLSGNSISPTSLSSDSHIPLTLEVLCLMECGIKEFPKILRTLPNLESIDLSGNRIDGKLPEWLWSFPRLSGVSVEDNSFNGFQGSVDVLVNSSVQILILDSNNFEGALPNLPLFINVFSASMNSFTGEIPLSICNRSSLFGLDLGYNNFTGPIPPCLSNITFVNLRNNNLDGSIPDEFYVGSTLHTLKVGYNRLTGKLPRSLLNCSSLQFLGVENNKIQDTFPFSLKALPNLQVLVLRSNKFFGPISPPHKGPLGFRYLLMSLLEACHQVTL
ncbi:unnamed protein product [Arabis nemorensis]|uniref:Leucine-rich repeat-containing N-terminal plant-type domain-containing protein n=1 Tax=Arabis nemorensis TaxID=586526 RepID=A0A565C3G6_9BRAS|nr:unnamed protein product [Arabis nemorensis]